MIYGLAFLMVSNIRYFSFKELNLARRSLLVSSSLSSYPDCDCHGASDCTLWFCPCLCPIRSGGSGSRVAEEENREEIRAVTGTEVPRD